jgi:two-component system cell cycle sensor histidine kinase/response regulator CckA
MQQNKRKVLLMEDEELLRSVTQRALEREGYAVQVMENGEEAIEGYRKAKEAGCPYDAVIVDLNIPNGKGGKETIIGLLELDPEVKVIISSADIFDHALTNYREYGFIGKLTKPYTREELFGALQRALDTSEVDCVTSSAMI